MRLSNKLHNTTWCILNKELNDSVPYPLFEYLYYEYCDIFRPNSLEELDTSIEDELEIELCSGFTVD